MQDYAQAYAAFDAQAVTRQVLGEPGSNVNMALLCCDRHSLEETVALYWSDAAGDSSEHAFSDLREESERCAQFLRDQGVGAGDRVASLLPRIPELVTLALAVWRLGAVYQPLFTAFGPKAIEHRVATSGARLIVTDTTNRSKLADIAAGVPVVTVAAAGENVPDGDLDYRAEVAQRAPGLEPVERGPDDPFLMMFTSGTTGPAKPLYVPIKAVVPFVVYLRDGIGLTAADRHWNIADPGWAYGLYYAVVAPLAMGLSTTFYNGPFTVDSTVATIEYYRITNLAGAPTAYRALMAAGPDAVRRIRGQLRAISSAGEPLNPEVISWVAQHLDATISDHYGQTEMGMALCNHNALAHEVLPGAAGFSMPGFRVTVIDDEERELPPGAPGHLAVELERSPLFWFTGYESLPTTALGERYYLTGDTAELNDNGSISFVGRDDDVITSAGYRIGPFDVESALIEHEAVVEAAVVGKPDPERTEIVKAFVVLREGCAASDELAQELSQYVKGRLSAHAYPREIEFVGELPKTPSGKIQRFLLREKSTA